MSPNLLASILADTPYPGCVVTRPGAAVRLDFDGLTLIYKADGWHFGDLHLESKLNHFAAEATTAEIRRILKVVMSLKVERALNEAEADGTTDPVEYLTNLAAEKMLAILDVAALANARQAGIGRLSTERDTLKAHTAIAEARISGLEGEIEGAHKVFDGVGVTWSTGLESGRLPLVKRAALAVEPGSLADAERGAMAARIAELERDLAAKDKSLTTAHAALAQVSDLLGSPPPVVPDDAVEAVKMHLARRSQPTPAILTEALDDAGAPKVYHLDDDTERPIPDPERIRLLGERVHLLRAQVREAADATNYLDALIEAHNALDDRHAPRLADGCVLSLAARIRSIPR